MSGLDEFINNFTMIRDCGNSKIKTNEKEDP